MNAKAQISINKLIADNRRAIKDPRPKEALKSNPCLLDSQREQHKEAIDVSLGILQAQFNELFPIVKDLKKCVKDITGETHIIAVYLLLCRVFQHWDSFFILANHQQYSAGIILLRNIKECLSLVDVFILECSKNERVNLDKWFSGEIIRNSVCREAMSKFGDEVMPTVSQDIKEKMTFVYSMESQEAHNSYVSTLESISPFTEDFDFAGYTNAHRMKAALSSALSCMTTTNITIKFVGTELLKDVQIALKIQGILLKYNPEMTSR